MPTPSEWRATLRLPGGSVECTIRRSTRARNLRLTIDPRHAAIVTVPSRMARNRGDAERIAVTFASEREAWLRRHLDELARQSARAAAMGVAVDGGALLFRGGPHRLRVIAAGAGAGSGAGDRTGTSRAGATSRAAVTRTADAPLNAGATGRAPAPVGDLTLWATAHLPEVSGSVRGSPREGPARTTVSREGAEDGDELVIRLGRNERRDLPAILEAWLKVRARSAIEAEIERHASAMGVAPAAVTVRDAKTRWGSCSRARRLSFSWRLVMAPPEVLETVVVHELAHLRIFGHGPEFWAVVASRRPDHRQWRRWLRDHRLELHSALGGR